MGRRENETIRTTGCARLENAAPRATHCKDQKPSVNELLISRPSSWLRRGSGDRPTPGVESRSDPGEEGRLAGAVATPLRRRGEFFGISRGSLARTGDQGISGGGGFEGRTLRRLLRLVDVEPGVSGSRSSMSPARSRTRLGVVRERPPAREEPVDGMAGGGGADRDEIPRPRSKPADRPDLDAEDGWSSARFPDGRIDADRPRVPEADSRTWLGEGDSEFKTRAASWRARRYSFSSAARSWDRAPKNRRNTCPLPAAGSVRTWESSSRWADNPGIGSHPRTG